MRLLPLLLVSSMVRCGLCLFFFVAESAAAIGANESEEAGSYIKAAMLNASAIKQVDYHMVVVRDEGEEAGITRKTTWNIRTKIDFEKERFLSISSLARNLQAADEVSRPNELSCWVFSNGKSGFRGSGPSERPSVQSSTFEEAAVRSRITDLRMAGLWTFTIDFQFGGGFARYKDFVNSIDGWEVAIVPSNDKAIHTRQTRVDETSDTTLYTDRVIHHRLLVPTFFASRNVQKTGDRFKTFQNSSEFINWKQMNEIQVPTSIECEKPVNRMVDGKIVAKNVSLDAFIHWFSVNEEFDEREFDPSRLDTLSDCLKLVDPVASNADTLPGRLLDAK